MESNPSDRCGFSHCAVGRKCAPGSVSALQTHVASARLTLYLGTLGAVIATITGLITHLRYEGTPVASFIDQHEFVIH